MTIIIIILVIAVIIIIIVITLIIIISSGDLTSDRQAATLLSSSLPGAQAGQGRVWLGWGNLGGIWVTLFVKIYFVGRHPLTKN